MRPLKEKLSIPLDADLVEKLRRYSEEDDRSLSQYINVVLKRHIEAMEKESNT
jgi:predicted DNA-binding protein